MKGEEARPLALVRVLVGLTATVDGHVEVGQAPLATLAVLGVRAECD